ncbi:MAG: hypothetical protein GY858_09900 [Candidatus Omnitrophica bacterium]|nr:hypothetical protein [Candidatus Omnitrophota bacterium]
MTEKTPKAEREKPLAWNRVKKDIRDNVKEGKYICKNWLEDIKVREDGKAIILSGTKSITIDYVKNNFEKILKKSFFKEGYTRDPFYTETIRFLKE